MLWIEERRGEDIPQDLYYPNYELDKDDDGRTPLMLWIKNRRYKAIPGDMKYPGW